MPAVIRPFHPSDLPSIYRICLLTGEVGGDATGAVPRPRPAGAPLRRARTRSRTRASRSSSSTSSGSSATSSRRPTPPGSSSGSSRRGGRCCGRATRCARTRATAPRTTCWSQRIHDWPRADEALFERFPAHMHIDLLPRAQGQGLGRRLVETLSEALRGRGVPGLYLGVDDRNEGAIAFYHRVGFELAEPARVGTDAGARPHVTGGVVARGRVALQREQPVDVRERGARHGQQRAQPVERRGGLVGRLGRALAGRQEEVGQVAGERPEDADADDDDHRRRSRGPRWSPGSGRRSRRSRSSRSCTRARRTRR